MNEPSHSNLIRIVETLPNLRLAMDKYQQAEPLELSRAIADLIEKLQQRLISNEMFFLNSSRPFILDWLNRQKPEIKIEPLKTKGINVLVLPTVSTELQFFRRIFSFIETGSPVLVKMPSQRPISSCLSISVFKEELAKSKLPQGLVRWLDDSGANRIVTGDFAADSLLGALIAHPAVRQINWFGRSENLHRVERACADSNKYLQASAGGRTPYVFWPGLREHRLESALKNVVNCVSNIEAWGPYRPTRIFLHESQKDLCLKILKELLQRKSSRIIDDNIQLQIDAAKADKTRFESWSLEAGFPVGIDGSNCSALQSVELYGAWLTLSTFKYPFEVNRWTQSSNLGLATFLECEDEEKEKEKAMTFLQRLPFGVKAINPSFNEKMLSDIFNSDFDAIKDSGRGPQGASGFKNHLKWNGSILPIN